MIVQNVSKMVFSVPITGRYFYLNFDQDLDFLKFCGILFQFDYYWHIICKTNILEY
ncbi:hypothetical protein LZ11_01149 [Thermosediminibacter litoriperuensis]|uniref:Uncharacterized protein n=1 Tax=Thermosediminibacter litoriperuensis TaxID=291989 RepID=A0A5S5ASK1_9FIRM|nr:hypothetical protein LZ11_01149 [Thermosediminibacter litoriperuensis]